jgi:hypothetical protein
MESVGGKFFAGREIDSAGAVLSQHIQWAELPYVARKERPSLSVVWSTDNGGATFGLGMLSAYFYTDQNLGGRLRVRFGLADTGPGLNVDAGIGFEKPKDASAYVRLGDLLAAAGDSATLTWSIQAVSQDGIKVLKTYQTGQLSLLELKAAETIWPKLMAALDTRQAQPGAFCQKLPASRE